MAVSQLTPAFPRATGSAKMSRKANSAANQMGAGSQLAWRQLPARPAPPHGAPPLARRPTREYKRPWSPTRCGWVRGTVGGRLARVVHVEIPVSDAERARAFHQSVFGWEIAAGVGG